MIKTENKITILPVLLITVVLTIAVTSINFTYAQEQEIVLIQGTPGNDTITINDAAGVVCGSPNVNLTGPTEPVVLESADLNCPGSQQGHLQLKLNSSGSNVYKGDYGDGADSITRIDGKGNDFYQYNAGAGDDKIRSVDGPGNDKYRYNNGPGNDMSVHMNTGPMASGDGSYIVHGGPGVDSVMISSDGPGNDRYTLEEFENSGYTDGFAGDFDRMQTTPTEFNFTSDSDW
jgi:hypothetical protein